SPAISTTSLRYVRLCCNPLNEMGADDYIFTALYQIDMHIDVNHLTGKNPYGGIAYLDGES
ncbi:MAG: hypothetical protein ACPHIX_08775, partial [Arenicellales bacterium]